VHMGRAVDGHASPERAVRSADRGRRGRRVWLLLLVPLILGLGLWLLTGSEQAFVVDAEAGDDGNAGTGSQPLATIGRGLELAEQANAEGLAARVEVRAGVYREPLQLGGGSGTTNAPLVIEGAGADQVIVDGTDIFDDWEPSSDLDGAYTAPWPHQWGLASVPSGWGDVLDSRSDVLRRREAVWVDGAIMRQVLTTDELTPGTFLVDEDTSQLTLMPPEDLDVDDAAIEVAVRSHTLDVDGWDNLTVQGLTFRRAATPLQGAGVRFINTSNILVQDVRSDWHNWSGLAVQRSTDVTLRRVALTHNGVVGLAVYRSEDVDVIDVDNSYNNTWRGPWADYYGWEAGSKVFLARGITFDGWYAVGNQAYGLWLDTDITDAVVRDSFIADNRRRGLFLEAMQGPVTVENNTICDNLQEGVLDGKANDVTLEGNRIFDNGRAQLTFSGEQGGRAFTAYDTREDLLIRSTNWTLRDNTLQGATGSRVIGNNLNAEDWDLVRSTLHATDNTYHHPSDPRPFTISGAIVDFAGWQTDTDQDHHSSFSNADPDLTCHAPPPPVPHTPPLPHTEDEVPGRSEEGAE
jgi:hypothetical protein